MATPSLHPLPCPHKPSRPLVFLCDYSPVARGPLLLLPRAVLGILREAGRHILRHPVVGVVAAARTPDGKWVLIRRADTGTWAMPGGTVEWGETLTATLERELREEA